MLQVKYQSQSCQDEFVEAVLQGKKGGFWLELGGSDARHISNTFYLEKALGWSGITIELNAKHAESYKLHGRNQTYLVLGDATKLNYPTLFHESIKAPAHGGVVDYLQIDLEPKNGSTWEALQLLEREIMPHYIFAVVTFEHDCYVQPSEKLREPARDLFQRNGYVLLFPDIVCLANNSAYVFEDWYVHPRAVSVDLIEKVMEIRAEMRQWNTRIKPETMSHGLLPSDCVNLVKKAAYLNENLYTKYK